MKHALGAAVAALASLGASIALAAVTSTVVDVPAGSSSVRILDVRPDAPVASIISFAGGSGFMGIRDDGTLSTAEGRCSPVGRNRQAFAEHGYAVALVNDAAAGNVPNLLAVIAYLKAKAEVPIWLIGGSSATPIVADLAVNLPATLPLGAMFWSPDVLSAALAARVQRASFVLWHSSDPTQSGAQLYNQLTAAPVKGRHVLTGGTNAICGAAGFHVFNGLDAEVVAAVAGFVDANNGALGTTQTQTAVEYYYADWNYYFVTSFPDEIAVLDGGAFGGVWKRTGQTFDVWSLPATDHLPACRFFSTAFAPKSSHFYTPFAAECAGLKVNPAWQYENIAFYLQLPDAAGTCPAGTAVLYRLYNNGMGGAPNHRFTTSAATFSQMQSLGWTFEGDGRTGAFACVPAPAAGAKGLWQATTAGGRTVTIAVLDDATYYAAYFSPGGTTLDGGLYGVSASADGRFASLRGRNVPFRNGFAGGSPTISGTYAARTSLDLVIGSGATAETVAAKYDSSYDAPSNLAALAGTYKGFSGHAQDWFTATSTIDANGNLTSRGGCDHRARLTSRGTAGVFDLSLVNGCSLPGAPAQGGILLFDAAKGTIAAMSPLNDDDIVFIGGTRQ